MNCRLLKFRVLLAIVLAAVASVANSRSVSYYYTDQLGSVLAVTDASGTVTQALDYTPYGAQTGGSSSGVGYHGAQDELDSSLVYMQARYLDSDAGRFISRDPFASEFNQYAYASNNPVLLKDPSGLYSCSGKKADCERFERGLAEIKSVASTLHASDPARARLVSVLKAYGSKDDGNHVSISFLSSSNPASTQLSPDGSANVNLDFVQLDEIVGPDGPGYSNEVETAAAIVHEGVHVADGLNRFALDSRNGVLLDEFNAFRTQAELNQAAGSISRWGLWSPGATLDDVKGAIYDNAVRARDSICKRRTCK